MKLFLGTGMPGSRDLTAKAHNPSPKTESSRIPDRRLAIEFNAGPRIHKAWQNMGPCDKFSKTGLRRQKSATVTIDKMPIWSKQWKTQWSSGWRSSINRSNASVLHKSPKIILRTWYRKSANSKCRLKAFKIHFRSFNLSVFYCHIPL